jgi:hypothetical protein
MAAAAEFSEDSTDDILEQIWSIGFEGKILVHSSFLYLLHSSLPLTQSIDVEFHQALIKLRKQGGKYH